MGNNDFSGRWHFVYWYPSNHTDGEETSEYYGNITHQNRALIFESEPTEDESYIFSRLSLDGDLASGSWHEHTSPEGFFKGMEYTGGGLLVEPDNPQSLAGGILTIARNKSRGEELSANAFRGAREHYTAANMADRVLEAYESVICPTPSIPAMI